MCGAHAVWLCFRDQGYVLLGDTLLFGGDTCWDTTLSKHMATCSGALSISLYMTPDSNTGASWWWRWQLLLNQYTLANTLPLAILGLAWPDTHSHVLETLAGPGAISEIYSYCFSKWHDDEMRVKIIWQSHMVSNFSTNLWKNSK